MVAFKARRSQAQVLAYRGGRLGVAAVPGAGKTRTLSALAAQIVASPAIGEGQEVLIVTLVNAAVDHFARQIGAFVKEHGLLARIGYRVRTLHGLCSDIVRERPALVGLGESFTILDEREADKTLVQAAQARLEMHPDIVDRYLDPGLEPRRREKALRDGTIARAVVEVARDFIRTAKDRRLTPEQLARGLAAFDGELPLVELCLPIYVDYQRALTLAGAVDFQDLIRLAYEALDRDPEYLARLRRRWPFILEDEAQDSSRLQEDILRLLVGPDGNWVRVGDPNQAIYETFTSARPEFLRGFLREPGVRRVDLPESGRSAPKIIDLANFLIAWSLEQHPNERVRAHQPLQPPYILPVPADDPQPNPPDDEARIVIYPERLTPAEEVDRVADSLMKWLPDHPDRTVAVLAATNQHGARMVEALRKRGIAYVERLRSTATTRLTAGALTHLLRYLAQPDHPPLLARAYEVWRRLDRDDEEAAGRLKRTLDVLRKLEHPEALTHPGPEGDWLESDP
ncbi:MAG: ATP-dependent helicase, partial [Anaerolinea sp.]|nr:ATP-dependent helicase [Anaerolinea sp.]